LRKKRRSPPPNRARTPEQSAQAPEQSAEASEPASLDEGAETDWTDNPEPEPEPEKPIVREGFVLLPFLGIALAGSGTLKAELDCQAGTCRSSSSERDYSQNPNVMLGFDTLYHVLPNLRVGLGLQWMPTSGADVKNGDSSTHFGDEVAPTAVVEGVFGGKSALALRGFVGPNLLFPQEEMQDLIDTMDAACRSVASAGGSCDVASGPYVGLTLGAAAAFLGQFTEKVTGRAELSFQYVGSSGPSLEVSDEIGTRYTDSLSWSGTRFSLRLGLEFSLRATWPPGHASV